MEETSDILKDIISIIGGVAVVGGLLGNIVKKMGKKLSEQQPEPNATTYDDAAKEDIFKRRTQQSAARAERVSGRYSEHDAQPMSHAELAYTQPEPVYFSYDNTDARNEAAVRYNAARTAIKSRSTATITSSTAPKVTLDATAPTPYNTAGNNSDDDGEAFDIRKAVIASEILNRKEF